ncbi:hypothetical protein DC366_01335 [Pelagivirga sediminicola]|uniref:Aromatic hydrocarbon degradation protein n=1 Tax=Pelagivirga sediminicola TaxID=2170575 RepID=A0A2T7GB38_9RHOB|nr:outer membrane protein transport protein [Pelagivirga sediminicola]PVA11637.1 hypothetical protein DC366_01335 [Pelagivirga sediminicola]
MKRYMFAAASTLALVGGTAHAGNLDRTKTPIDIIFEEGNHAELSFGSVSPTISGRDYLGNTVANVADDFTLIGSGIKFQLTDRASFAIIQDQPYGVDVLYGGDPASTLLGGTMAQADTTGLTMLMRYDVGNGIGLYGGPRVVRADGEVTLSGLAYGPLNGYNVRFRSDQAVGYVLGAVYEIPEIAFRAALTYHSEIDLEMPSVETFPAGIPGVPPGVPLIGGTTNSTLPQSVKLQVQSGIAENTLAFGSIRWSEHSVFTLVPPIAGRNLTELDDAWSYEVGLGRRLTDKLSASIAYMYEDEENNDLVSPLAPTKGRQSLALRAKYQVTDAVSIAGGIRYIWIGDAQPETPGPGSPDVARAAFTGNDAIGVGMQIGISF